MVLVEVNLGSMIKEWEQQSIQSEQEAMCNMKEEVPAVCSVGSERT